MEHYDDVGPDCAPQARSSSQPSTPTPWSEASSGVMQLKVQALERILQSKNDEIDKLKRENRINKQSNIRSKQRLDQNLQDSSDRAEASKALRVTRTNDMKKADKGVVIIEGNFAVCLALL